MNGTKATAVCGSAVVGNETVFRTHNTVVDEDAASILSPVG